MANNEIEDTNNTFFGRGWAFPVQFNRGGNEAELVSGEKDIKESLQILLSTIKGERIMRHDFGANVEDMVFEPLDVTTANIIKNRIKRAILFHEPRINVDNMVLQQDAANGTVTLITEYTIIATNSRTNLVFPFYETEATNVST